MVVVLTLDGGGRGGGGLVELAVDRHAEGRVLSHTGEEAASVRGGAGTNHTRTERYLSCTVGGLRIGQCCAHIIVSNAQYISSSRMVRVVVSVSEFVCARVYVRVGVCESAQYVGCL